MTKKNSQYTSEAGSIRKTSIAIGAVIFLMLCFMNGELNGQTTGLSIVKQNDLAFGDIFIGYTAEVFHADANAAKFVIDHNLRGKPKVLVSFNLPTTLNSSSDSIPIVFDQSHTAYSTVDAPSGATNFNPFTPLNTKFKKRDKLYIWLGGLINATSGASAGTYQGTIVITVELI